jgi:uncharacterized protein YecE (DUF72 family)
MAEQPSTLKPQPRLARVRVGLGSWADKEYVDLLYPKGLPAKGRLNKYATWFDHVEVNSSYYRTPQRPGVEGWVQETPPDFSFDVKLHRAFSEDPDATAREGGLVARLLEGTQPLVDANKLGAFLLLLPASFGPKRRRLEELDTLVEKLAGHLLAVELRNRGWIDDDRREQTFDYFRTRKLVWVAVDMPRIEGSAIMPPIDEVTNPKLAYLRLHGRNQEWPKLKTAEARHTYEYPENELQEIAGRVRALAEKADEVHVFANNHAQDFAPKAALGLKRLLG